MVVLVVKNCLTKANTNTTPLLCLMSSIHTFVHRFRQSTSVLSNCRYSAYNTHAVAVNTTSLASRLYNGPPIGRCRGRSGSISRAIATSSRNLKMVQAEGEPTHQDKLIYFHARARGEPIRILHALANRPLLEERIKKGKGWETSKQEYPLGQLPVYKSAEGELIMSNSIARYVAKKYGLMGSNIWEEALNDMIQEICFASFEDVGRRWYFWKLFKFSQEPKNPDKIHAELRENLTASVRHIQSIAEENDKKYIISDKMMLADVSLYTNLEFWQQCIEDSMSITPWVEQFVKKVRSEESIKDHIAGRPKSLVFGL